VDDGRELLCRFAAELDHLGAARSAATVEQRWRAGQIEGIGWQALAEGRRPGSEALLGPLEEVDGKLLAALRRLRRLADTHLATFRVPALERMQHASAAALTGARWGLAGLRTLIYDRSTPLGRRYFAFLALAERHPTDGWPLFERVLDTPTSHHAFLAAAADAARYYGGPAADALVALFNRIRRDDHLRRFLGPHILGSLYVLEEPAALQLARELLVAGHTVPDPERCEVTRAVIIVRRLTGALEENVKYRDVHAPAVVARIDAAEALYEQQRDEIGSVVLI
jgi:hypothetical protein